MNRFLNRREAGIQLADRLVRFHDREDVIVLGLPRGGVPVAYEIARRLSLPLDVFVVRKIGAPGHEEFAIGAIASGGVRVLNREAITAMRISPAEIERLTIQERRELERREVAYRGKRPFPNLRDRTVIVVDDGLATGATMQAAIAALRRQKPASIVVAAPVVAPDTCAFLRNLADACEYVYAPDPFYGVGLWYEDFEPTSDTEVTTLIDAAARLHVSDESDRDSVRRRNHVIVCR